ncbi:acyltransferase family protein [Pendulispora albinea]|uniref:Acyltransferase n=1 Tax=Pendulispora albinea TaxID=2741071 RepID=A0ABZ2LSQ1_9BACT
MGHPQYEHYLRTSRFESLDGLRCLSILPVIWHHSTPRPLPGILGRGPFGVDLFFSISGFLITTLLLRERRTPVSSREHEAPASLETRGYGGHFAGEARGISLKNFYLRRTLRIFPLYYAVLALYALRGWLFLPDSPLRDHFFRSLPFYATYTPNWFVDFDVPHPVIFGFSWSLAVEEQFYLVWPWVVAKSRGLRAPVVFMLAAVALDFFAEHGFLAPIVDEAGSTHRVLVGIATPICLGALVACALHARTSFAIARMVLGRRGSAPILLAALAVLLAVSGTPLVSIHIVMALLVAAVCIRSDHGLARLLNAPLLRLVGVVSYGMYLFHVSAITGAKWLLPVEWCTAPMVFFTATCVTFFAAWASYRFFETPFLSLKNRFRS